MSNPLFDRIKIGKSTKDPTKDRLGQLNEKTGTPEKYKCEYYAFVGDEHGLELAMHRKFSDRRPNARREFFEVGILEVINAIRDTAPNFGGIKYEEIYYQDLRKIEFENGNVYEGEIKNNLMNGHGTHTWPDGTQYVGNWDNGERTGHGTQTWPDGQEYVGNWNNGQKNGQGTLILSNGVKYVCEWKDDQQNGYGTLTWPDGHKYVGNFKNGQRSGQGKQTWNVGRKYVGEWKDGKENGQGVQIGSDGEKEEGIWEDGKMVKNLRPWWKF